MFVTIPTEIFPTTETIAKLFSCKKVILADNLKFNKRHKTNQIQINEETIFSANLTEKNELSSSIIFHEYTYFRSKILRILTEKHSKSAYYFYFFPIIQNIIKDEQSIFSIQLKCIQLIRDEFQLNFQIENASNYSEQFNLAKIIFKQSMPYFVENNFKLYIDKQFGSNTNIFFDVNGQTPINSPDKVSEKPSFFELLFNWGPYIPKVLTIDSFQNKS